MRTLLFILCSLLVFSSVSLAQGQGKPIDVVIIESHWGGARNPRNLPSSDPLVDILRLSGSRLLYDNGTSAQPQQTGVTAINPLSRAFEDKLGLSWVSREELEATIVVKNIG